MCHPLGSHPHPLGSHPHPRGFHLCSDAYCDSLGPRKYMGAGAFASKASETRPYAGAFKCAAQVRLEMTLTGCTPGWHRLTRCSYFDCGRYIPQGSALLCGRCRSVVFCSKQCQSAAWTGVRGAAPTPPLPGVARTQPMSEVGQAAQMPSPQPPPPHPSRGEQFSGAMSAALGVDLPPLELPVGAGRGAGRCTCGGGTGGGVCA